jgi:hypothetical protein
MKTNLPEDVLTVDDAKTFLLELISNNEVFHPDDDPADIVWGDCEPPLPSQYEQLSKLMYQCCNLPSFDAYGYILKNVDL